MGETTQAGVEAPSHADVEMLRVGRAVEGRLFGRPTVPLCVSRYVLLGEVARGGEGTVFEAFDPELDRKVAVKIVRSCARQDGERRLLGEAQALAKLDHPNVIPVHDVGTYDFDAQARELAGTSSVAEKLSTRGVYVVMEYAPGQDLRGWLEARTRSWREVVAVFRQAGEGLAAAHRAGIVHRDFKPSNVIHGPDGRVRVVDFGLAQASPSDETDPGARASKTDGATLTGVVAGTPAFMSPEQHRNEPIDARSDQYSFCVSLYQALFGRVPFAQPTLAELEQAKLSQDFVRRPNTRVPRWLARLLATGLAADPEHRHASMDEVCAALGRPRLSRRTLLIGAVGVTALATWSASTSDAPTCADPQSLLDGVWNQGHKSGLRQAVEGQGAEGALRLAPIIEQQIDAYAATWASARTEVCEAGRQGRFSPERVSAAELCLDRALVRLGGVVQMLSEVDPFVVARGRIVVSTLPRVSTCVERSVSLTEVPTEEQRAALLSIEADISRARMLVLAGRPEEAVEVSQAAVARARELDQAGPLAHALLQLAMSRGLTDREQSARDLRASIESAEAAADPELAIEGTAKLAFVMGAQLGEVSAALALLDLADARAAQLESNAFSRRHRLAVRGQIHAAHGELEQARETWARALELERAASDRRPAFMAELEHNLGVIAHMQSRSEQALGHFERAWQLEEPKIPGMASVGTAALGAGQALLDLGRPDDAVGWLERALWALPEDGPRTAEARLRLGIAHARLGNDQSAHGQLSAARAQLDSEDSSLQLELLYWLARTERALGRAEVAATLAVQARALVPDARAATSDPAVLGWLEADGGDRD